MKVAILIVGHSQTDEWEISANYYDAFPDSSILKNSDILAYVNCRSIRASKIESYLDIFPQKNKFLLYTPMNGHSVSDMPLDVETNLYKQNYSINRKGYLYGILEAYHTTFDLLKNYDYVVQVNPDVYITDHIALENYMVSNFDNKIVHHVNTMRGDAKKGFSCDFTLYRPNILKQNYFSLYKSDKISYDIAQKSLVDENYRFLPEQILKSVILESGISYNVMCPSTRNDRKIDEFGLWHCHDCNAAREFLKTKKTS